MARVPQRVPAVDGAKECQSARASGGERKRRYGMETVVAAAGSVA
jgi:hypothetical protein